MAFTKHKGKTKIVWLPRAASVGAIAKGSIVAFSGGNVIVATSSTAASAHVGVLRKAIATTDADYAVARLVPVEVPVERGVEWRGAVTSGLVAADVGLWVDLTDGATINRGASTYDAAQVRSVISATEGTFILNLGGATNTIS